MQVDVNLSMEYLEDTLIFKLKKKITKFSKNSGY